MERKTYIYFFNQVFATFGIIVAIFIVLGNTVGETASANSSLFALGKEGITFGTLAQIFLLSVVIMICRVIFRTDILIKDMSIMKRNICLFVTIIVWLVIQICVFDWFSVNSIVAWLSFGTSFIVCSVAGVVIGKVKEDNENRSMEEALKKINK